MQAGINAYGNVQLFEINLDAHVFRDVTRTRAVESFFGEYGRCRLDRLQTLLSIALIVGLRRHGEFLDSGQAIIL